MIVNLTPHPLVLWVRCGCPDHVCEKCTWGNIKIEIPSAGIARVSTTETEIGYVDGVPVVSTEYGAVEGLPRPVEGTSYVVSTITAQAVPYRRDVFVPARFVRDEKGNITGCTALGKPAKVKLETSADALGWNG